MKIGCVGIGQAGLNLAIEFSQLFPSIIIDTAQQNLNSIKNENIEKFHIKINEWGGAGKDALLGQQAIRGYKKDLTDLIKTNLSNLDYIWVTAGLGGGTGTLGCCQVSNILHNLNIPHGLLATIPDVAHEGTDETTNCVLGLKAIENARQQMKNLRSIIYIENAKLKEYVLTHYDNSSYENLWSIANKYVFEMFNNLFYYSQQESQYSFDGQDYIRLFLKSGYMYFGKKTITNIEEITAKNSLGNVVRDIWQDNIFIDGLEIEKAKGAAVIVNRPKSFDQDGKVINQLFNQVKNAIGSGTYAFGVYKGVKNKTLINKTIKKIKNEDNNSLEIFTLLSGMPFPKKRANQLKGLYQKDIDNYNKKDKEEDFNIDIGEVQSYVKEYQSEENEEIDFDPFKEKNNKNNSLEWDF